MMRVPFADIAGKMDIINTDLTSIFIN